ncbi:breast carcinoma-amplified sequence 3 homolog isoform X2 [Battus philenor]|uniref:breast carcinoma-amplified sequence 3 homolog isoform X2 n=1 Tax=Battus philenor TaxID=42288 RepID=UPI0035CF4A4F
MSAESPRHVRSGGPLTVPSQPPSDRGIIDAVSGFINDVTLSSSSNIDPKDVIQWARFETADINEPTPEGDSDKDTSPLLLILGYGSGVQVWLIPNSGDAQEVLSWRQGTVRVLRILPTPQHGDCFASKRPLIALCDSASPGPSFCSLSFISIRGGEQVKSIKFKNPILDVLANKRSVVVSFSERFAVFDAATLEDRLAVTTCYPCPCPLGGSAPINPLALGERWLAYAEKKLNPSKRSSGGCEGEGATSYTATVLHAAKSLSKGLRGLGESVAHSLAGGRSTSQSPSPPNTDVQQPGVITVLDIEGNEEEDGQESEDPCDPIVAHFLAHSEAIIALKFDPSGMLLVTADRRGHDFHVFRINPHPFGPTLASVHHLYILHRGDTTAKVQDIALSADSRWTAISTLRGTTHVFAISPYGGACGVRTHTQPRVVNRLSRFQRSAGLPIHSAAHAHSPVCEAGWTSASGQGPWYPNPRLPPFPAPTITQPLAQLRPTSNLPTHTITRTSSGRQRLSSLSEETSSAPLLARACFGAVPVVTGTSPSSRGAAVSLYLMAAGGSLLHLVLHPRAARNLPKEKICDESAIELEVEPAAQWPLQRPPAAADLLAPLPPSNPLLQPLSCRRCADMCMSEEERWLSQVEIVTHAGPHRRLWMGPQFVFKTYNCTGSNSSLSEAETVEVDTTAGRGAARSTPVNMPGVRPIVPVLIDSGSASSLEHSPSDSFRRKSLLAETGRAASVCDVQLREDLAEAMKEEHDNENKLMTEEPKKEKGCKEVKSKGSKIVNENKQIKEDKTCVEAKTDKNDKGTEKISDPINFNTSQLTVKDSKESVKETTPETLKPCKLEPMKCSEKEQAATIDVEYEAAKVMKKSVNDNKNITEPQSPDCASDSTKLEDQAWDMLLNEPKLLQKDKPALLIEETEDTKIKTKKARKMRRVLEDSHSKDDDSFVEIHNIEDKPAADTGELVSISTPFEEFEPSSSYLPKSKKSRSPKMNAKDKENDYEQNVAEAMKDTKVIKSKFEPRHEIDKSEFDMFSDFNTVITKEVKRKYSATEIINVESSDNNSHNVSSINSGVQKSNKNKSPSQAPPISKSGEIPASDSKEVYVINTSEDDFPDIQITKGNKARKKSPQPSVEVKSNQSPVVVAPVKSWSTIAASKNVKKVEPDVNATIKETATNENNNSKNANTAKEEGQMSENTEVSLQEKLMELCKRTDIIVAECGAPSELNFVEEHHSVLHELTPLEGLEFGLDEFKLEVMKDSLLEVADMKVTSPICKINIDDILLSMKETANKVVDSNTFNLIDIEKVPWKKEKGFSVVETDKITSQEVKIDVETKSERERESEMMEKSSDDDVASPVLSTDSDKDEKKGAEASSLPQTLSKQSKSKKSRRKKK